MSATISWRFQVPVNITAQAAIGEFQGVIGEIGFSAFVQDQDETLHLLGNEIFGSWSRILFADRVTQVDVSARSFDGPVNGSAVGYIWGN
jgi:hypothetical protein